MPDPRLRLASAAATTDLDTVLDVLARPQITIVVSADVSPAHRLAQVTLHAMLGRVFPNIDPPLVDGSLPANPWAAATVAEAIAAQPMAPARTAPRPSPITIAVGPDATVEADLYVDGNDWTSHVSTIGPAPVMAPAEHGGLGLQAAAALAANEVFKTALEYLGFFTNRLDGTLVWNLLDYTLRPAAHPPGCFANAEETDPLLFGGAGSLGSSAIGALATTEIARDGEVVDDDTFDPNHNPYRYPASTATTEGPKATWAARVGATGRLALRANNQRIGGWAAQQETPGFDGTAVITVDRTDGRLDAANVMARATISAGVSGLSLQIHRSYATDASAACSYCLYVDAAAPADQLDVYRDLTGLSEYRILELLNGDRLTVADLAPRNHNEDLVGRRLEDLVRVAYAEATVPLSDDGDTAEITAPHVSWLAGVIIAAEIAKDALGLPALDRRLRLDLRGLPLGVTDRPPADPTGRCICHNPVRHSAAASWY